MALDCVANQRMNGTLPIRVALFHIMSGNFSGAGKNIFRLVRRIDVAKLDTVLIGQTENELTARVRDIGLKVLIVPYPAALDVYDQELLQPSIGRLVRAIGGIVRYNVSLLAMFRENKIEVVWADNIRTFLFVYPASKLRGCKVIWNIWSEPRGAVAWTLHRVGLLFADSINLEYSGQAEKLFGGLARLRMFRRKLVALYTGVTDFDEPAGTDIRRELGLSAEDIVILMACNISPAKGQMDLLIAMRTLVQRLPNVHLLLAGRAPATHDASVNYQSKLEAYVSQNDLRGNVHFLGWRSDMTDVYCACDIFASTSYSESFPDAAREAMRAGKPVVATNVGGTAELVHEGESGRLFEPGDVQTLVSSLSELVVDVDLRHSMGQAGRCIIAERFSTEEYARAFENMVVGLLRA